MPQDKGVSVLDLDRLLNSLRADAEQPQGRIETKIQPRILTINDRILNILENGTILSCNGIVFHLNRRYEVKSTVDSIGSFLSKLTKLGKIQRAKVNGKYFYWRVL